MTASAEARETALIAAQAAADKLATDVSIVDVSDRLAITDAFVLTSAPNERQVQSIVDAVEERLREHGVKPVRREGVAEGRWVLLDFVDVVVHVQHAEERAYYALERLWKDCPVIPFTDRDAPPAADSGSAGPAEVAGDHHGLPCRQLSGQLACHADRLAAALGVEGRVQLPLEAAGRVPLCTPVPPEHEPLNRQCGQRRFGGSGHWSVDS